MLFYFLILAAATDVSSGGKAEDCVHAHNVLRGLHENTGDVTWDDSIAAEAKEWANHLAVAGAMQHAQNILHGENLFWKWDSEEASCEEAVLSWYNELTDYSYTTTRSTNGKNIGHFTQVVWKSSTKIGVGIATKNDGSGMIETYIVARYKDQGNFVRMQYGETYETARRRIYKDEVNPRKPGAVTPTLFQLNPSLNVCKDKSSQCSGYQSFCGYSNIKSYCPKTCGDC